MTNEIIILSVTAVLLTFVYLNALGRVLYILPRLKKARRADERQDEEIIAELDRESTNSPSDDGVDAAKWSEEDKFPDAANVIRSLKGFVENQISKIDGRSQRKFQRIPRYDYLDRVAELRNGRHIEEYQARILEQAFSIWRAYRSHRLPVPEHVLNTLRSAKSKLGA